MNRLRATGIALAATLSLGIAAACGGDDPGLAYQPVAYGQQVQLAAGQQYQTVTGQTVILPQSQNSWVCYYVNSIQEVIALQAAGLCPHSWLPILMDSIGAGLYWHELYAPYYDSYGYYGRYVPPAYRNTYVSHVTVFETHYHTQIVSASSSSSARWKGSDGKQYNGAAVSKYMSSGKASFGSGSVRSAGFASSTLRSAAASNSSSSGSTRTSTTTGSSRSTTSSGSSRSTSGSGGGFSGGSRSTSSGSSRSYTSGSSSGFGGGSRSSYSGSYSGKH